jgi:hypothetical protein
MQEGLTATKIPSTTRSNAPPRLIVIFFLSDTSRKIYVHGTHSLPSSSVRCAVRASSFSVDPFHSLDDDLSEPKSATAMQLDRSPKNFAWTN